jgi:hypothetical protein
MGAHLHACMNVESSIVFEATSQPPIGRDLERGGSLSLPLSLWAETRSAGCSSLQAASDAVPSTKVVRSVLISCITTTSNTSYWTMVCATKLRDSLPEQMGAIFGDTYRLRVRVQGFGHKCR